MKGKLNDRLYRIADKEFLNSSRDTLPIAEVRYRCVKLLRRQQAGFVQMVRAIRGREVKRQFTECPRCYRQACDDLLERLDKRRR